MPLIYLRNCTVHFLIALSEAMPSVVRSTEGLNRLCVLMLSKLKSRCFLLSVHVFVCLQESARRVESFRAGPEAEDSAT